MFLPCFETNYYHEKSYSILSSLLKKSAASIGFKSSSRQQTPILYDSTY